MKRYHSGISSEIFTRLRCDCDGVVRGMFGSLYLRLSLNNKEKREREGEREEGKEMSDK